eukprot:c11934_g1_i1.p2 GENE.c11934_g1_i1~~c11934_g1_i1.p2  ORF type:complete len:655 (+),score=113.95 c11934_g1_i1:164-2128(+)
MAGRGVQDPRDRASVLKTVDGNNYRLMSSIFSYFDKKGFWPSLFERIFAVIVPLTIIAMIWFLSSCIDYDGLFDNTEKVPFGRFVHCRLTPRYGSWFLGLALAASLAAMVPFTLYQLYCMRLLWQTQAYVNRKLGISDALLHAIPWTTVATRVIEVSPEILGPRLDRKHPAERSFTERDVRVLLCKYDNYFNMLYTAGGIDMTTPWGLRWLFGERMHSDVNAALAEYLVREYVVEPVLSGIDPAERIDDVTPNMAPRRLSPLDNDTRARRSVQRGATQLFWLGVIAASPPVCAALAVVSAVYLVFRHLPSMRREPQLYGRRAWSHDADWRFRLLDELRHNRDQRLNRAFRHAAEYMGMFPADTLGAVAKYAAFASGSLAAMFWILGSWADGATLLGVGLDKISQNIFICFLLARALIPNEFIVFEPARAMRNMQEDLHLLPGSWVSPQAATDHEQQAAHARIHPQFKELFELRVFSVARDFVSCVVLGWTLIRFALAVPELQRRALACTGVFFHSTYSGAKVRLGFMPPEDAQVHAAGFVGTAVAATRDASVTRRCFRWCCVEPDEDDDQGGDGYLSMDEEGSGGAASPGDDLVGADARRRCVALKIELSRSSADPAARPEMSTWVPRTKTAAPAPEAAAGVGDDDDVELELER